jgi:putative ABC transport system permease protein
VKWLQSDEEYHWVASQGFWAPTLMEKYPEVEAATKIVRLYFSTVYSYNENNFAEKRVYFADENFMKVFPYKVLQGNAAKALQGVNSMIMTESTAQKYFGSERAVGKVVKAANRDYTIGAVIEDVPVNSHFHFDMLLPMNILRNLRPDVDGTSASSYHTYFRTKQIAKLRTSLRRDHAELLKIISSGEENEADMKLFLQPITDIHLHGHGEKELEANSDIKYIYIFATIALFVLLIGCINYMNLATAKSSKRGREVGIRKIMGSKRQKIFWQYIGESYILVFIAAVLALVAVELILPIFNQFSSKSLQLDPWNNWQLLTTLGGIVLLVGFLSGSYPAIFLANFSPIAALKSSSLNNRSSRSALILRRILVVCQFSLSILLIIGAVTVFSQLNFMQQKNLGFNKEQVMVMNYPRDHEITGFKELVNDPQIKSITALSSVPGERVPYLSVGIPNYEPRYLTMRVLSTDASVFKTLGLEIAEGRAFSEEFANEAQNAFILNESAVKELGLQDPVGRDFEYVYNLPEPKKGKIVGIVKDFNFASLHNEVEPLVMHIFSAYHLELAIKLNTNNISETIGKIKNAWVSNYPDIPFEYYFLDNFYDNLYRYEMNMSQILISFTIMAIFIACLGLLGLASFIIEQKTKEIAIRKILGASVPSILSAISREFLYLVAISAVIAWLPAYFLLKNWLNNFAYHTQINFMVFLLAGVTAGIIAVVTIVVQSLKTALANPAEAIKYE